MYEEAMKLGFPPCGKLTITFEATDEGLKIEREIESVNEAMIMEVFAAIDKQKFRDDLLKIFLDHKFDAEPTK
jgi:hypothetical protein